MGKPGRPRKDAPPRAKPGPKPVSARTARFLDEARPLRAKEAAFVAEYLRDLIPGAAAVRAGYGHPTGASLAVRPPVARAIAKALAARSVRVGISADRVLAELGNLAFSNPKELFGEDGRLKPWSELTDDQAKMIGAVKTKRAMDLGENGKPAPVEVMEYTFVNKLNALTLVMRHLGLFNDHVSVDVTFGLADRLRLAQARLLEQRGVVIDGEAQEI